MNWSAPADIRAQVIKLWDKGLLLRELAGESTLFPLRLRFKKPTAKELSEHFSDVRDWVIELRSAAQLYRIEWRNVQHRVHGQNQLPSEIWIDSLDAALSMINRKRDAYRFRELLELTNLQLPELKVWLAKRPLQALELADEWKLILDIVSWAKKHSRPGIYLRQVDLPGVHSKMIERHKAVLAELFDLALEPCSIVDSARGNKGFCERYGFREKPISVRFRILDQALALLPTETDQDISVSVDTFAKLDLSVNNVFVTENEINFLAFPSMPRSLVIFGAGYGFGALSSSKWLHFKRLFYWGDLDTHGFAILDQFRSHFPSAESFLMDEETLLAHKAYWGSENTPESRDLPRLTSTERELYDKIRGDAFCKTLRLEQERIGYQWIEHSLAQIL